MAQKKNINKYRDNALLVKDLTKGIEAAYVFLVNHYSKRLFAYALTFINDHALAQDILQNVFISTWKHRQKLSPKYNIQSFLYKSVYNEFINQYRHQQVLTSLEKKYYENLEKIVVNKDNYNLEQIHALVASEIESLPPKCHEVFCLSKKEGLTNIEISQYLGISVKTVEGQITKAFKILRLKLNTKVKSMLFLLFGFKKKRRL